jgi:hypothetical protein
VHHVFDRAFTTFRQLNPLPSSGHYHYTLNLVDRVKNSRMEKNYRDNNRANVPKVLMSCVHVLNFGPKTNKQIQKLNIRTLLRNFNVLPHTTVVIT